jgi:hypothetical protein
MDDVSNTTTESRLVATALYPFIPSGPHFETAIAFFEAIGFDVEWRQPGVAGLRFGGAYFLLQDIHVPVWQENQMVVFEVTDLDTYWERLRAKNLPALFDGVKVKPPTVFPWGRELHLIDPAGVCWHVRQSRDDSRPAAPRDGS